MKRNPHPQHKPPSHIVSIWALIAAAGIIYYKTLQFVANSATISTEETRFPLPPDAYANAIAYDTTN